MTDPVAEVRAWLRDAAAAGVEVPEAMTLATATAAGVPSARMVLLKGIEDDGSFLFFTGYASRKGRELAENPRAALVLYWHELGRQVRIEGAVEQVSREESEAYFATRPRGSRLAALASRQSAVLGSRDELTRRHEELERAYGDADEIPLPEQWGGYRLRADAIELWRHGEHRLHERVLFTRARDGWSKQLLSP